MVFLGIAGRDGLAAMQSFVDRHGLHHFAHAVDPEAALWARFGFSYQPAWAFVTADGRVERRFGALSEAEFDRIVAELFDG